MRVASQTQVVIRKLQTESLQRRPNVIDQLFPIAVSETMESTDLNCRANISVVILLCIYNGALALALAV